MDIQAFGPHFDLDKFIFARDSARALCHDLSSRVQVGMTEEDLHTLYKSLGPKYGVEKNWHPPKLRVGVNTTKSFKDPSEPVVVQEEDIFFLDLGPVIEGHEADYGEPFFIGENFEHMRIVEKSQELWNIVASYWRTHKVSGHALYDFAVIEAEKMGYKLNLNEKGHRVSDFPHALIHKGKLMECEEVPVPYAWILEIHLIHPDLKIGAFFEDILV